MIKMSKDYFTVSDFYCVKCGAKGMPLARKMSRQREKGHLKKLYCLHCKQETNHREIREFDLDYTYNDLIEDIKNGVYDGKQTEEDN